DSEARYESAPGACASDASSRRESSRPHFEHRLATPSSPDRWQHAAWLISSLFFGAPFWVTPYTGRSATLLCDDAATTSLLQGEGQAEGKPQRPQTSDR